MRLKRFLAFVVAFAMVMSVMPAMSLTAFAEDSVIDTESELAAALTAGGEVVLGGDILVETMIEIPAGITTVLDLNGYAITSGYQTDNTKHIYPINNYGILTIKDSKGTGSITGRGIYVQDGSKLTVESGSIYGIDSNGGSALFQYGGDIVIDGGHIEQKAEGTSNFAINAAAGTVTVNNGEIYGNHGAIAAVGAAVVIYDGTFVCTGTDGMTDNVLYSDGSSTLTINGGTFTADSDNPSGGCCVYDANGKTVINGGTFGSSSGGDVWGTTGTTINGGTFENLTETNRVAVGAVITNKGVTYEMTEDGLVEYTATTLDLVISTADELVAFAADVNAGNSYSGKVVALADDIDLTGINWTPIGLDGDGAGFAGTFDGRGYTVSNLTVDTTAGEDNAAGLFGSVRGTLKNFTVKNATIKNIVTQDPTVDGTAVIAGCTGYGATIENVHVDTAKVESNRYVGGISGYAAGNFTGCTVKNVTLTAAPNEDSEGKYDNGDKVGGIVGYVNTNANGTTIDSCQVENVVINAYRDAAGIAGMVRTGVSLTNNKVTGNLTINIDPTLCGEKDSYNTGEIAGRDAASATMSNNDIAGATYTVNVVKAPVVHKVATKAELDSALAAAKDGDTILLTADIDYSSAQLAIEKAITLDLGGKTLTSGWNWGGITLKNNPSVINGTINHVGRTAAIKAWNVDKIEDVVITVAANEPGKVIGGIVLQSGNTTRINTIKNVTINGEGLTNGIETYNCGDATEDVIGSMENVTIDAQGTGMLISAPVGTATSCNIKGGVSGIELWIKGTYSATLDLAGCEVEGGTQAVYVHDEFSSNPDIVNNGELTITADSATKLKTTTGVQLTQAIERAENVNIDGIIGLISPVKVTYDDGSVEFFDDMLEAVPYTTNCPRLEGATITLMKDVSASGLRFMENDMVFDLNGFTYTITQGTGSQGSNTSGFQIRPEVTTDVLFKNGTINVHAGAPVVWMFNCYATDFIVENVTVDCADMAYSYGNSCYVGVSRAGDNIQLTGTTEVINFKSDVAGDAYSIGGTMTVADTVEVGGTIQLDKGASLTAREGLDVVPAEGCKIVYENGVYTATEVNYVAQIGTVKYETLADALADAEDGDTVTIIAEGEYTLPSVSAKVTIEGYDQEKVVLNFVGVAYQPIASVTDITFKNLTINKTGAGYAGLHHATKETYDNCIINGELWTYATEAVFTQCTFNQTSSNAYNLWTYGSSKVTLDSCTLNSAGKSVLLYNEGTVKATELIVIDTDFVASAPVAGKAAIEIDTSSMGGTSKVEIDNLTTATGFAAGSVSGNTLWNDKKNKTNIEVYVADEQVWPKNYVAENTTTGVKYETLADALEKAVDGDTVTLLADINATDIIVLDKAITLDGNDNTLTSSAGRAINVDTTEKVIIKNLTVAGEGKCERGINVINNASDLTLENVKVSDVSHYAIHVATSAGAAKVTVKDGSYCGYAAIAVYGAGTEINVTNAILVGTNTYEDNGSNSFATIVTGAENTTVNVTGGSVKAVATAGKAPQAVVGANAGATGTITLDSELIVEGVAKYIGLDPATVTLVVRETYAVKIAKEGFGTEASGTAGLVKVGGTIELPTATVTEITKEQLEAGNAPELTFALNFLADEATDAQKAYYGDWYADYVLTLGESATFNANGGADGYLAGQYDAFNTGWLSVPDGDVAVNANTPFRIMKYAAEALNEPGLQFTYAMVLDWVKDFDCGIFFEPEFIESNPGMEVTLELRLYNPDDETENYLIGETYTFKFPVVAVAEVDGVEYTDLQDAIDVAVENGGDTVTLLADNAENVQIADDVTVNLVTGDYTYTGTVTMAEYGAWIIADEEIEAVSTVVDCKVIEGTGNGKYGYVVMVHGVDMIQGAQVRIGSYVDENGKIANTTTNKSGSGLRFITEVNFSDTLAYYADHADGEYTTEENGKEYIYTKGVMGVLVSAEGSTAKSIIAANSWQTETMFTSAITNLAVSNYVRKFTANPYVDVDGIRYVNEVGVTRSIYQVAAGLLITGEVDEDASSDGNHTYDPTEERLLDVLNAYVNQTGIRLVLVDGTFAAHDGLSDISKASGKNGYYGAEAYFTVGNTSSVGDVYSVTLTPRGNAVIKTNTVSTTEQPFWYEYVRINNNNGAVKTRVKVIDNKDGTYTLQFDASGTGLEPNDNTPAEDINDVVGTDQDNEESLS